MKYNMSVNIKTLNVIVSLGDFFSLIKWKNFLNTKIRNI